MLLLSSSNGRGCSTVIQEKLGNKYEVSGIVQPNTRLVNVVEDKDTLTKNFNKNDCVVVLGGTNDLDCYDSNYKEKSSSSLKKAQAVSLRKNVIFNSIPNRFDDQVLDVEREKLTRNFPSCSMAKMREIRKILMYFTKQLLWKGNISQHMDCILKNDAKSSCVKAGLGSLRILFCGRPDPRDE